MKHKICKGKIYVTPMSILGILKHFVEDFKLRKNSNHKLISPNFLLAKKSPYLPESP